MGRSYKLPNNNLHTAEIEVLQLYAHGLAKEQIAGKRFTSFRTAEMQLHNAFAKLNSKGNSHLAICKALRLGIISIY